MNDAETMHSDDDSGIDRKALRQVRDRFLEINSIRLARTRLSLGQRKETLIDLLPLLFHVNHPLLPGYTSGNAPCGIGQYTPDKDGLRAASQLTRSFRYQRKVNRADDLHSVFIMGSAGSLGHSGQSDLDIWVCHQSTLSASQVAELSRKCGLVSDWCRDSLNAEVHFFPMSPTRFSRGETGNLSTEDCGSAQHFLLLEEFYRTAVLLAGRYPIWWLTPPDMEHRHDEYAERLRRQRFVRRNECIDFGSIPSIPPGEFVGAGLWQIYKAIDSPYKSVLKSLLTELYASEHPDVQTISLAIKRRIYGKLMDPDELDPYVVIYRRLESYLLEREETERLELIRRCMYIKAGHKLSQSARGEKTWSRKVMERLVEEWGWQKPALRDLDLRSRWKAHRVSRERREVVNNLTYSYRFLSQFASENRSSALISAEEMALLGRKLYATYERRANKIEWLNPGIGPDISETEITIALHGDTWMLFNSAVIESEISAKAPLKRSRSLLELLVWCHVNGLLGKHTLLNVLAGHHQRTLLETRRALEALANHLPQLNRQVQQDNYRQPAQPGQVLVFINIAMECSGIEIEALNRISDHTDPLSYSKLRDNLVITLDLVLHNSWNEIYTYRYQDEAALGECLLEFMRHACGHEDLRQVNFPVRAFCFTHSQGSSIAQRIEELFLDVRRVFLHQTDTASARFVVEIGERFLLLQFVEGAPHYWLLEDMDALIQELGKPQTRFSPVLLDPHSLQHSPLGAVCRTGMTRAAQTFLLERDDGRFEVFVTDPNGSLLRWISDAPNLDHVVLPLRRFLEAVWHRYQAECGESGPTLVKPEFYRLQKGHGEGTPYVSSRLQLPADTSNAEHHAVQAIASRNGDGKVTFTIYCNHLEFSALEHGDDLFRAVARHIVGQRQGQARYPCYITDLDLSNILDDQSGNGLNLSLHLQYKQRLEAILASAMKAV